jgi:hypothetical protein
MRRDVDGIEVDRFYRAFCAARLGRRLDPGEYEALFSAAEFGWIREALHATRATR